MTGAELLFRPGLRRQAMGRAPAVCRALAGELPDTLRRGRAKPPGESDQRAGRRHPTSRLQRQQLPFVLCRAHQHGSANGPGICGSVRHRTSDGGDLRRHRNRERSQPARCVRRPQSTFPGQSSAPRRRWPVRARTCRLTANGIAAHSVQVTVPERMAAPDGRPPHAKFGDGWQSAALTESMACLRLRR
jgi:hypothetical protein